MRKRLLTRLAFAFAVLVLGYGQANAQLTGTKTIPGDYASIAAAFTDLNTQGVGAGGVTFNVATGYTETAFNLQLTVATNPPSATRPIVFQRSGAGANPLITASAGVGASTTTDGLIKLDGVDYVTFNGIDLAENVANVTAATQLEWGYALVKTSATNGAQNNTIKNCTITLTNSNTVSTGIYLGNHTAASTTGLTVTAFSGTNSYNRFQSNTVQNAYFGYQMTGFNSAAPFDLFDQGNSIGTDVTLNRRSQVIAFGGGGVTAYGIYGIYQNNITINKTFIGNATGPVHATTLNGIFMSTGTNSNVTITNDTVALVSNATTSQLVAINNAMGATGAGNTVNISNCVVTGCTYTTATSGEFRGIAQTASATNTILANNTVSNFTMPGTGQMSGIYYSGSGATIIQSVNINNNTVTNLTKTGTGGNLNGIYASGSTFVMNTYNNTVTNLNNSASSADTYGYYNFAVGYNENVYDNLFSNIAGGTGRTDGIRAESGSGPTNKLIYGNTVHTISGNTAGFLVSGISSSYTTQGSIYRNNIYNIANTTATGVANAACGINLAGNNNIDISVYNNFISDLRAANASNVNAVTGIAVVGTTTSHIRVYYNTVYLNAISAGANFGTSCVNIGTNPVLVDLRNNILYNGSTPNGTGFTRCIARGSTSLSNYATTSGFNCLYAGIGANRFLYSDGTNNAASIIAMKALVGSREQGSFSEQPPFINSAATPYNLHLLGGSATQCESGGVNIAGFTTDYDNNARYPNAGFPTAGFAAAPDVGADEFGGTFSDIASPDIQYTALTNSSVATTRTLTAFATITDPSGINNTAGTKPRLYYKKSTQANTYNSNTNATDGWKYVEASNAASPYNFTIDYSLLFSGSVVAGDIIQYFVVAQDLNGTPNFGVNAASFNLWPTSVNLGASHFPAAGLINQYTIVTAPVPPTFNVGPAETITSLTNVGGLFQLINSSVLSSNVTVNITGDLTAETGTIALNQWAEEGTGNYTLTIQPSAAVTRTISGTSAANPLIRLDGADRVTFDGRFGGSGTFITVRNLSNAAAGIQMLNDAQNNTLRNLIVESGNTSTAGLTAGAVIIGTTTGINGNDNNTITGCEIRDRSDVAGNTPAIGINCNGTTTSILTAFNNNCTLSNNNIHDWFLANGTTQNGINIGGGNTGFTISGNSLYQTSIRTNTVSGSITRGISVAVGSTVPVTGGFTITNNFVGGTAPGATGGDMTLTVAGAGVSQTFLGIVVNTGLLLNNVQGNTVTKIDYTTNSPAAAASVFIAMQYGQGIFNIGTTTGNVIGGATGNDLIKIAINTGGTSSTFIAGMFLPANMSTYDCQNNTVGGITISGTNSAAALIPQYINVQGTPGGPINVSNNLVGSLTTANSNRITATLPPVISFGLRQVTSTGTQATYSNNTLANYTNLSGNAGSAEYGILIVSNSGVASAATVTNNTIRDYASNSAPVSPALSLIGIALQAIGGQDHVVSNNSISNLSLTNPSALGAGYVIGIQHQGNNLGGTMSRNKIWGLSNQNSLGTAGLAGFYVNAGNNWTYSNNMVSISNGANTNTVTMYGMAEFATGTMNLYYNTFYVAGTTAAGASNSYAFMRGSNSIITAKNNFFYNQRTGGTGFNYAIGNTAGAPAANWTGTNVNNNYFVSADATRMGEWGVGTGQTLAQWQTSSGSDASSYFELNTALPAATVFAAPATGNLKINSGYYLTPSNLESNGVTIGGISIDQELDTRPGPVGSVNGGGTAPDIGADEFDGTPYFYDAAIVELTAPTDSACYDSTETVSVTFENSGNVVLDFVAKPITINCAVTGPNPQTFTPVVVNTGTLAVGASQTVVFSTNYNMSAQGVYVFTSNISMTGDEALNNDTLTPVTITIDGGTVSATPNPVCAGNNTTLSVSGYTFGGTIQWEQSLDGTNWTNVAGATSASEIMNPADTTWYRALICGLHYSDTVQVNTLPGPVVALGPDSTMCVPSITLDAGNIGSTYLWSDNSTNQTFTATATGTYSVTVTDGSSCQGVDTVIITINAPPVVNLGADTVQCGGTVLLDAGGTGGLTYLWNDNSTNSTLTASSTGSYAVTVTAPGFACEDSDTIQVTINAQPVVNLGADTTVCGSLTLDAGNPGMNYNWSTSATTQTITVSSSGTFGVTVTNAGCTDSDDVVVTVNPNPIVTLTLPQDTVCQELGNVTLSGGSPSGGTFSGTGVSGTTFDPVAAGLGTSTITYTFTDVNGCSGTANDTWFVDICTGTEDPAASLGMEVYPNPNNGQFWLSISGADGRDVQVDVITPEGKVVQSLLAEKVGSEYRTEINLTGMSRGVYLVKVQAGEKVQVLRVVSE